MFISISAVEKFAGVSPNKLYHMILDGAQLAAATGAEAQSSPEVGTTYFAYNGYCHGHNLHLVPNELIVQTWQGQGYVEHDSIVVMRLEADGDDTRLYLTHANLTPDQARDMAADWQDYYWSKFRAYLAAQVANPVSA